MNALSGSQRLSYSNNSLSSTRSRSRKSLAKSNNDIRKSQNIAIDITYDDNSKPANIDG